MAFSATHLGTSIGAKYARRYYSVNFASVTSGIVKHYMKDVIFVKLTNNTGLRADTAYDLSTAKQVTISGVTANDVGLLMVVGRY